MAITKGQDELLKKYFADKPFVDALLTLLARHREQCEMRYNAIPKEDFYAEAMSLLLAKGGRQALEKFRIEIERLAEVAIKEGQVPPGQA